MAVLDLQAFIRERAAAFDETLDVSPGSPFDQEVVQPLVRRLGQDPFTVDLSTFLHDRIIQAFPEMATEEGDAITDLLIKPARLLWDPIIREINRIRTSQSLRDPTLLTTDEAEALVANTFTERNKGGTARGPARLFFSQPRTISVSPANFCTTRSGLHFFPDGVQAITLEEMLLNLDGSLYYFDFNVVAEAPGVSYNIDAGEIVTIANVEAAVRVTNLRRFRDGSPEEGTTEFVDRASQELTERSLVTQRGIGARLGAAFPEIRRLGVVGFGDVEMQRDIVRGGGLGSILSFGRNAAGEPDGYNSARTKRIRVNSPDVVDFTAVIGPTNLLPSGYVVTLTAAFGSTPPLVRDLAVAKVISATVLELEEQVINPAATSVVWSLRRKELTISGIPGGILFPDNAQGEMIIPDDEIHIGGMFDICARGSTTEIASLSVENVSDESPIASGVNLSIVNSTQVSLGDYVLDTDYAESDPIYLEFQRASEFGYTLQILDGVNAGNYRVVSSSQLSGAAPVVTVDSALSVIVGTFRWRLVDTIEVGLVEPRDIKANGTDLFTVQNTFVLETSGGTDFSALGVSANDTVRLLEGPDAGDFTVQSLPAFNKITVNKALTASVSSLSYEVFRANTSGGVQRPLVRVSAIELLDSSNQPVGSTIPYAKPVDIQSRAFQNPGRGPKVDVTDATLGIVSVEDPGGFALSGLSLTFTFPNPADGLPSVGVNFGSTLTAAQVVTTINASADAAIGPGTRLAEVVDGNRVGIVPIASIVVLSSGTARAVLFGSNDTFTTADVRSASVDTPAGPGWTGVSPAINQDDLDVLQVLDGLQIGSYGGLHVLSTALVAYDPADAGFQPSVSFLPEVGRHIRVGSRSIGSVRCFFLAPTSVEFDGESFFTVTLEDGVTLRYFPDPTVSRVKLPAAPSTELTKDGESTQLTNVFTSAESNFVLSLVRPGDQLEVLYLPIIGSVTLADPVLSLALTTIILSVDGGLDQTITFVNDLSGTPGAVSRAGVAEQINEAVGRTVAKINSDKLELEGDVSIVVRKTGTSNSLLGLNTGADSSNASPHASSNPYTVLSVATTTLTLNKSFPTSSPSSLSRQGFRVIRPSAQRISTAEMQNNVAEAGLYYFDVELVSEGTGDLWNIPAGMQLTAEGFRSDGYWLSTEDPNLTFSVSERPVLHLSRSILDAGVSDDPQNATQITGQNIEITYDKSVLVNDIQNFASSDAERVVCANPLARHLTPHYIRFDFEYIGGSRADIVEQDVINYINSVYPADFLESSDLQDIAYRRGASSVRNPLNLIAIVHYVDRRVWAQRSQDRLNTGRLAAFIPDIININRRTG